MTYQINATVQAPNHFWVEWTAFGSNRGTDVAFLLGAVDVEARYYLATFPDSSGINVLVTTQPGTVVWDQRTGIAATLQSGSVRVEGSSGLRGSSGSKTANLTMRMGSFDVSMTGLVRTGYPFAGYNDDGTYTLTVGTTTVATITVGSDAQGQPTGTVTIDGVGYPLASP